MTQQQRYYQNLGGEGLLHANYLGGPLKYLGGFPKLGVPFLGVPIIRTIVYWGLYWGTSILGSYHLISSLMALIKDPID